MTSAFEKTASHKRAALIAFCDAYRLWLATRDFGYEFGKTDDDTFVKRSGGTTTIEEIPIERLTRRAAAWRIYYRARDYYLKTCTEGYL